MTRRGYFWFGMVTGAWLNIWPPLFFPFAGFVFAYLLLPLGLFYASERHTDQGEG
jgi:hypothetical protein